MSKKIYISATEDAAFTPYTNPVYWEQESYPVLFCQVYPWDDSKEDDEIDFDTELDNFVIHADEFAEFMKAPVDIIDWDEIDVMEVFENMKKAGYINSFPCLGHHDFIVS